MSEFLRRLRALLRGDRLDRDLEEEMRAHMEMSAEENRENGMRPDEARNAARRQFGNATLLKETSREMWGWGWLDALAKDLRFTLRGMRRNPLFAGAAVLTLALAIGANMAIFTLVYNVVLRPVRYPRVERLMSIELQIADPKRGPRPGAWSHPDAEDFRQRNRSFESLAAFRQTNVTLSGIDRPELIIEEIVSASYFRLIGIQAACGRVFTPDEDTPAGARPVVLISDALWRRVFGGDPGIIGRTIRVDGAPASIIGLLPPDFRGETGHAEVWASIASYAIRNPRAFTRGASNLQLIGLRKPGVSPRQADEDTRRLVAELPNASRFKISGGARPLLEAKVDPIVRRSLWVLQAATAFVLLIGCVNLANLLLGRGAARRREAAIRLALGASRGTLVRQLLVEPVLLALLGGAAGLLLAKLSLRLVAPIGPEAATDFPGSYLRMFDPQSFGVEPALVVFGALLSLAAGLLFGILPAWRASRSDLNEVLKSSDVRAGGPIHLGLRNVLVAGQLALALVLLAGAGLIIRSFASQVAT